LSTSIWSEYESTSDSSFFSGWDFFTDGDPTHGNVQYVDGGTAKSDGLASVRDDNVVVIAVDDKNKVDSSGNRKA